MLSASGGEHLKRKRKRKSDAAYHLTDSIEPQGSAAKNGIHPVKKESKKARRHRKRKEGRKKVDHQLDCNIVESVEPCEPELTPLDVPQPERSKELQSLVDFITKDLRSQLEKAESLTAKYNELASDLISDMKPVCDERVVVNNELKDFYNVNSSELMFKDMKYLLRAIKTGRVYAKDEQRMNGFCNESSQKKRKKKLDKKAEIMVPELEDLDVAVKKTRHKVEDLQDRLAKITSGNYEVTQSDLKLIGYVEPDPESSGPTELLESESELGTAIKNLALDRQFDYDNLDPNPDKERKSVVARVKAACSEKFALLKKITQKIVQRFYG